MVTQVQASEVVGGGVQSSSRGRGRIDSPLAVVLVTGLGLLIALATVLVAYQARSSSPEARPATGDAISMAQQRFLDHNTYLPTEGGTGVASSRQGSELQRPAAIEARDNGAVLAVVPTGPSQQGQLYAIEVRDNGVTTVASDNGPCRKPWRSCDR
jgi:hypothetical protein